MSEWKRFFVYYSGCQARQRVIRLGSLGARAFNSVLSREVTFAAPLKLLAAALINACVLLLPHPLAPRLHVSQNIRPNWCLLLWKHLVAQTVLSDAVETGWVDIFVTSAAQLLLMSP